MDREGRGAPAQRCRTPREPPRVLGSAGPEQPTERPTAAVPLPETPATRARPGSGTLGPPQPRETGRLAAPPPRSPWPGPLPVRSGARRPGGGGARRNAAPPPPAGTAGQRPGPPLPPREPSAPRRAPGHRPAHGSARSLLKPRVYGKPPRLGTNNSTRFERRCFISRAQRGAEPLYLTFFLGRRLLVWPHFFLRQLTARGWRRA